MFVFSSFKYIENVILSFSLALVHPPYVVLPFLKLTFLEEKCFPLKRVSSKFQALRNLTKNLFETTTTCMGTTSMGCWVMGNRTVNL